MLLLSQSQGAEAYRAMPAIAIIQPFAPNKCCIPKTAILTIAYIRQLLSGRKVHACTIFAIHALTDRLNSICSVIRPFISVTRQLCSIHSDGRQSSFVLIWTRPAYTFDPCIEMKDFFVVSVRISSRSSLYGNVAPSG